MTKQLSRTERDKERASNILLQQQKKLKPRTVLVLVMLRERI